MREIISNYKKIELTKYSRIKDFSQCFSIYAIAIFSIFFAIYLDNLIIWILYFFFMGFMGISFLSFSHNCIHGFFFKSKFLRHAFGSINSIPLLVNYSIYNSSHIEHHKYTNMEEDVQQKVEITSLFKYLSYFPYLTLFINHIKIGLFALLGKKLSYKRLESERKNIIINFFISFIWLLSSIILTLHYPLLIKVYWIPLFIFHQLIFLFRLSEHYGCNLTNNRWENSRSITSNFIVRFLMINNNFHAEHHFYPSIPFQNLHKLHLEIGKNFKYIESSYFKFHIHLIYRCFNLRKFNKNKIN
ncbi:fatty acid desaturase family protein [Silvanigrella aquatica]|uniref:Fatty acid desaturase domain-containing protein n=1 Tax=Silvanigrella aquatica TaxID=1915309 RepID=A0A1L4CX79_9BACT|nr:fatty acid desaturase [Silvanigrella aquatica]APJ02555.1 hypothetical protein AXG55_00840 [Silvanigrella aquatica]